MARVQQSLNTIEQGYPHREHRSRKGRIPDHKTRKSSRLRKQRIEDMRRKRDFYFQSPNNPKGVRKGKWI